MLETEKSRDAETPITAGRISLPVCLAFLHTLLAQQNKRVGNHFCLDARKFTALGGCDNTSR